MTTPQTPTTIDREQISQTRIAQPLQQVAAALLRDQDHTYRVYYHRTNRSDTSWIVIARAGADGLLNLGTVQTENLDGFSVNFSIKPSQSLGSSLLVSVPGTDRDPRDVEEVVQCAELATGDSYENFATTTPVHNHGPEHIVWTASTLVEIVADDQGAGES